MDGWARCAVARGVCTLVHWAFRVDLTCVYFPCVGGVRMSEMRAGGPCDLSARRKMCVPSLVR